MTDTLEAPPAVAAALAPEALAPLDELFQLQLRVARRADQLALNCGSGRHRDRRVWLQAETDVIPGHNHRTQEAVLPVAPPMARHV